MTTNNLIALMLDKKWMKVEIPSTSRITHGAHIPGSKPWGDGAQDQRHVLRIWEGKRQIAKIPGVQEFWIEDYIKVFNMRIINDNDLGWVQKEPADPLAYIDEIIKMDNG